MTYISINLFIIMTIIIEIDNNMIDIEDISYGDINI